MRHNIKVEYDASGPVIDVKMSVHPKEFIFCEAIWPMEQQHDVYNATSRSVELRKIPKSLRAEEEVPRFFREDLPVEGARVFVLRNFFTPEECKFFIDATEGKLTFVVQ